MAVPAAAPGPLALQTAATRPQVLLGDDQPARLLTYESVLEGVGVTCVRALSGREALEKLLRHSYAVILLDISMPEMDGFETARNAALLAGAASGKPPRSVQKKNGCQPC